MTILEVKQVDKAFGATEVLRGVDLRVGEKERVGLIGPNGAGKSTLLKIITSQIPADRGEIHRSKKVRIGYLAQDSGLHSRRTMWEEVLSVFAPLKKTESRLRELEREMGRENIMADESRYQQILEQYSRLQEAFEQAGGYETDARARGALHGLGLGGLDWNRTLVDELSGGQKTRLALAKLLLEQPDLLILDEPTNYLDMDALAWLEHMLNQYPGAVLVVSHDRYFLDRTVSVIYEIDRLEVSRYKGNYTDYVRQKADRLAEWQKQYEQQQAEIRKMEDFIQRNIARASTAQRAQSRRKALEKLEKLDRPPLERKKAAIRFEPAALSGKLVAEAEELSVGYEDASPLIRNLSFRVERGERIALIGPNGAGKSTLLKTFAGVLKPLSGTLRLGTGVELDYYDQEQEALNPASTVLEEVWNAHPHMDRTQVRSLLGQFLFSGDDVFKRVADLSGGEKARLSLLKRLLNRSNLLLMDEPTNHLDMDSKERLEEALETFGGTLIFVSHDRYFINRLATTIWEIRDGRLKIHSGDYSTFLEKKKAEAAAMEEARRKNENDRERNRRKRQKEKEERRLREEARQLEEEILQLEAEKERIQEQLCRPEVYTHPEQSLPLQQRLNEVEETLSEKTDRWAEIADV